MRFLDEKFINNYKMYVLQAAIAGCAVTAALFLFDVVNQPVIIASFGASAFIAFTMPHNTFSNSRHLIGGYACGVLVGCLMHYLTVLSLEGYLVQTALHVLSAGLAVIIVMLLMTVTNTEHAPATSLAVGFVINDWSPYTVLFIMIGITVISAVQRILRPVMIDLV